MLSLFKNTELLDEYTIEWLFDTYAWALRNFDSDVFYNDTLLVTPTNQHFSGEGQGAEGDDKANFIFSKVKEYAGLGHWPCQLVDAESFVPITVTQLAETSGLRGAKGIIPVIDHAENTFPIQYDPGLLARPEALIASYAHTLSHYLGSTAQQAPPGGTENWPQLTEVLSVFMGFGLMFANSAHVNTIRSCGSCQTPVVNRQAFLSQYEIVYALAIFTVLKQIPNKKVTPYLKKTLHTFYKKAVKDVTRRKQALEDLSIKPAG